MGQWKVIATLTWQFESDSSEEECLEFAKSQVNQILPLKPHGEEFDGFMIQVDLAKMKERKRLVHLATFELDEVFPYITEEETKREYIIGDSSYWVRMNSDRYHVFKGNNKCVVCDLVGTKIALDINPGDAVPHFNLYAEEHGRLILMTKDHKIAKSRGGQDLRENYQTMCSICNNLKGAHDISVEQIKHLRTIWDNDKKVPRKELRRLLHEAIEKMYAELYT